MPATVKQAVHAQSADSLLSQKAQLRSLSKMSTAVGSTDRKRQIVRSRKEQDATGQKPLPSKTLDSSTQQFELLSAKEIRPRKLPKRDQATEVSAAALSPDNPSLLFKVSSRSVENTQKLTRFSRLPDLHEAKTGKSQASPEEPSPDKRVRGHIKSSSVNPQNHSILDQFIRLDSKEHNGSLDQTSASHFSNRPLVITQAFERPTKKRSDVFGPNLKLFNSSLMKKEIHKQFAAAPLPPTTHPQQTGLAFDEEAPQDQLAVRAKTLTQTAVPFKELVRSRVGSTRSKKRQSVELLRSNSKEIQLMISVVSSKQENLLSALPPIRSKPPVGSSSTPKSKPAQKLNLLIATDLRPDKPAPGRGDYLLDSESEDFTQLLKEKRLHF